MKRLIFAGMLVTVLLVAFAGSALADGPHGYNMSYGKGYGSGGYGSNYGGYNYGMMNYGGYSMYQHYRQTYTPCPYQSYGHMNNYNSGGYGMYGGYAGSSMGYGMYGGYAGSSMYNMQMSYGSYHGYGY